MKEKINHEYTTKNIVKLEGLSPVRERPGMYIGTTDVAGLHHLLWEIVDNSVDEALNKYANTVNIVLYADGSVSVEDNGRGIPVDLNAQGKSGAELVFTELHAGGKFVDKTAYEVSGGLHGVGASVVNALSEWLHVEVYRGGIIHSIKFASDNEKKIYGKLQGGVEKTGKTDKKGTLVRFKPDKAVFKSTAFDFGTIDKKIRETAYLIKGLKITLRDERKEPLKETVHDYKGGIKDFVSYLNAGKSSLYNEPLYFEGKVDGIYCELSMQHTDSYSESIISFVNNIPTSEGGMHEIGLKSAITKAFNDYARTEKYLRDKDANFMGEDFREGLTLILSIKMREVQFEGQTKTKLGSPEAKPAVEEFVLNALTKFMSDKKNQPAMVNIMEKALGAAGARMAAKKAKDIARQKNSIDNAPLVGKLAACTGRKAENNELFIVEGDSAGGTAKTARDRYFQAILPLRGKPLNAEKQRLEKVLANEEIRTIISALGCGIGADLNMKDLNYHKVVILSDADQDGAHIRAILLTFFYRHMKELVVNGNIYIGMPPLYKISKKETVKYAYNDAELEAITEEFGGKSYNIQRYKGLGEMNAEQLWDTTMDPKVRNMIQVTLEDAAQAEKMITVLMGEETGARKEYIFENADFNKEDNFIKRI